MRLYYVVIAYAFLCVSVSTFAVVSLIFALSLIDLLFRVGFGYPPWSVAVLAALVLLGFALTKTSMAYLKKVRQQDA
jgi:hypothetical protein